MREIDNGYDGGGGKEAGTWASFAVRAKASRARISL